MVSERFLDGYRASGMSGIAHIDPPAEIVRVGNRPIGSVFPPPPRYHNVWYVYGGASLDEGRSGAVRPPVNCAHCRRSIDGFERVILEDGSWRGDDIFDSFGLPGHILVTSRFKELCDEWEMTGATFIPAESYYLIPGQPLSPCGREDE
jgi:hypothetical protein